jgi:MORN repeat
MFNWFSKDKNKTVEPEENEMKDVETSIVDELSVTKETQSDEQPSEYETLKMEVERLRTELYELKKTVESKPDVLLYYDGTLYVGDVKNNLPDGFGTICYSSGARYCGEWKDGLYNGKGAFYQDHFSLPFYSEWVNHLPK